jgi:hypothetical protein
MPKFKLTAAYEVEADSESAARQCWIDGIADWGLQGIRVEQVPEPDTRPTFNVTYEQTEVRETWVQANDADEVRALFASGEVWFQDNPDRFIETTDGDEITAIERLDPDHHFNLGD